MAIAILDIIADHATTLRGFGLKIVPVERGFDAFDGRTVIRVRVLHNGNVEYSHE